MRRSWDERGPSTRDSGTSFASEPTHRSGEPALSEGEVPFEGTARFQVRGLLGRGGMGVVYRVLDVEMGCEVALKTLPRLDPHELLHLKEEFRARAGIPHVNLIELYDLVVDGDRAFFTMELVDGDDFCAFVGEGQDRLERLAAAMDQLASGLDALHRADKLHRDIKPSNVLVTRDSRVVLLDFGLAIGMEGQSSESAFAGTPQYMSPEQAWGKPLEPAADWYQVGVMLYEALTRELPFSGSLLDMVEAKQRGLSRPPSAKSQGVPPDLDALIVALLSPEPQRRAGLLAVRQVFPSVGGPESLRQPLSAPGRPSFVGRDDEMAILDAALARAMGSAPAVVTVDGPSGMGKTELCRRFTAAIAQDHGALVLKSRCHPQESVPYKALDGIVDSLSRILSEMPWKDARALAPNHVSSLIRVFPVLGRVESFTSMPLDAEPRDPHEARRLAFGCLGALLSKLAERRTLIVWIDDAQWSDRDSALLMEGVFRALSGPILILLSYRAEEEGWSAALRTLIERVNALPPSQRFSVSLGPLGEAHARSLALHLIRAEGEAVADITEESMGSPFLIRELSRHHGDAPPSSRRTKRRRSMGEIVGARFDRLTREERSLLEIVATAGGPVDRGVALAAAGLGERGRPDVMRLSEGHFVRATEIDGHPAVETYHDKIREVLLDRLPEERRRDCHGRLAGVMKALPNPDPEALFVHCSGAGDTGAAAGYAVIAADRAATALAFERACSLYEQALALGAPDAPAIHERLGQSLVNAGRGVASPTHFLEAARAKGGDEAAAITLHRKAAEQLVRNGGIDEGIAAFDGVFRRFGLRMPRSTGEANLRLLKGLVRLLLRGISFTARGPSEIPVNVHLRLDALWGACSALGVMDPPRASALAVQHLLEALDAGDPERIAHGLCHQAVLEAAIGGRFFNRRAEKLLAAADAIVADTTDSVLRGFALSAHGSVAWHQGRFEEGYRDSTEGVRIYSSEGKGTAFHRVAGENYALSALSFLGDMKALADKRLESHRRAQGWGDGFGTALFQIGQLNVVRLAEDAPELAIAEADAVSAGFPLRRYHHTIITVQAELYRGDVRAAKARLDEAWDGLVRDGLLRLEFPRIELTYLRARVELGCLPSVDGYVARGLRLWKVGRMIKTLTRSDLLPAAPFCASVRAGVARAKGDREGMARWLREAAVGFHAAKMRLYEEAHWMALGEVEPCAEAEGAGERMKELGVKEPAKMAKMIVSWR